MWLEFLRLIALLLCLLSLCAVFHTAFLVPASDLQDTIHHSLELLALSACISLAGGMLFVQPDHEAHRGNSLFSTLPVQVFFWSSAAMLVLFLAAWYLENYGVFYRDAHPWH